MYSVRQTSKFFYIVTVINVFLCRFWIWGQLEGLSFTAAHTGIHTFAPNAGMAIFLHSALKPFWIIIPASGVSYGTNFIFVQNYSDCPSTTG